MAADDKKPYLGANGSPKPREPVAFVCPICGCEDFGRVWVRAKNEKLRETEMQECKRCTVVFHSALSFSKKRD